MKRIRIKFWKNGLILQKHFLQIWDPNFIWIPRSDGLKCFILQYGNNFIPYRSKVWYRYGNYDDLIPLHTRSLPFLMTATQLDELF
jgi:hypothetical protein